MKRMGTDVRNQKRDGRKNGKLIGCRRIGSGVIQTHRDLKGGHGTYMERYRTHDG